MDFDDAYANAAHIPGAAAYPERWRQKAADFRGEMISARRAELDISYGQAQGLVSIFFYRKGRHRAC